MQWSNLDLPHCRQILYCLSHQGSPLVNEKLPLPSWFVQISAMASIPVSMPPVLLSVSHLFAFSYCSWGSQGKNAEVVCHSLLQWTTFCWRRLLRVPWIAGRSNQSILKEINPEYSLEGLMLKLKLQYFGHLTWSAKSLEKTLMLGKFEGREKKGMTEDEIGWMASLTQWTWVWASSGSWWWTGRPGVLQTMGSQRVRHDWVTEQQQNTPLLMFNLYLFSKANFLSL